VLQIGKAKDLSAPLHNSDPKLPCHAPFIFSQFLPWMITSMQTIFLINQSRAVQLETNVDCTVPQGPSPGPHYKKMISSISVQNTYLAMIRSMKHKHRYKNWTHKVQNHVLNLNVANLMVLKNLSLKVC
jgi:hypothetical protein